MDASASLPLVRTRFGITRAIMVALLAVALLLGATGGYLIRGWISSASTTTTTPHPFVTEPVPHSSPAASPALLPTLDPKGFAVPI